MKRQHQNSKYVFGARGMSGKRLEQTSPFYLLTIASLELEPFVLPFIAFEVIVLK